MVAVALALVAPAAAAQATVTAASGGPRTSFDVTFPAQRLVLDLHLEGPGRCANLDSLVISIRQAQTGHFRFGPRVPGARPTARRQTAATMVPRRLPHLGLAFEEFEPSSTTIASGRFTVR